MTWESLSSQKLLKYNKSSSPHLNLNLRSDLGRNRKSSHSFVQEMHIKCLPVLKDGHREVNENKVLALTRVLF